MSQTQVVVLRTSLDLPLPSKRSTVVVAQRACLDRVVAFAGIPKPWWGVVVVVVQGERVVSRLQSTQVVALADIPRPFA